MMPTWQSDDGAVKLYCGDCSELIPELKDSVEATIVDPPYGLGNVLHRPGATTGNSWRSQFGSGSPEWDKTKPTEIIESMATWDKPSCIWGGNNFRLPPNRGWFVWDKKTPDNFSSGNAELAWTNIDRPTRCFRMAQCEAHDEMRPKQHPTQKPLSLMAWCIRMMRLGNGAVVFDPFMGSGTTGVACVKMGRKFIGIEIEPKYFEIAKQRIQAVIREKSEQLIPA